LIIFELFFTAVVELD